MENYDPTVIEAYVKARQANGILRDSMNPEQARAEKIKQQVEYMMRPNLPEARVNPNVAFNQMVDQIKGENAIQQQMHHDRMMGGSGLWNSYSAPNTPPQPFNDYVSQLKAQHSELYARNIPNPGLYH